MQEKIITTEEKVLDAKVSLVDKNYIYLLTQNFHLQKVCIHSNKIIFSKKLAKQKLTDESKICFKLSKFDKFLCLYNEKGQFGYVYNLAEDKIVLQLDRGDYHTEQNIFPLQFFYENDEILLIHCKDWNDIHVTNLSTNQLLTERINAYDKEFYIDYFYGELHISPNQQKLLTSGWIWQPVSTMKWINLDKWLTTSINEPEISEDMILIWSYYWDRAVCWINDKEIVYLYDPREEGDTETEDIIEKFANIELNEENLVQSYLVFYDTETKKHTKIIPFNYSQNEDFEGVGYLFFNSDNNKLICSSKELGTRILSLNGDVYYHNPQLYIDNFCNKNKVSVKIEDNQISIVNY